MRPCRDWKEARLGVAIVFAAFIITTTWNCGSRVLRAQARATPKFTTATVKQSGIFGVAPTIANGRFVWRSASPVLLIRYAYEVASATIEGKVPVDPGYDIEATFPPSATALDVREMLKSLLVERFGLRVHKQTRRMPLFKLNIAPGGPKLVATAGRPVMAGGRTLQPGGVMGYQDPRDGQWHHVAPGVTAAGIARVFADQIGAPVLDATGIRGVFDINVVVPSPRPDREQFRATFLTTVPQQLGLTLEPSTGSVDMLVIDQITPP
jgi:uncharacterized protein (TIGR03435 family)